MFSTGFSTSMTPELTTDQLDSIIDQFSEIIVDGMDTKTLCQYVYDDLVDYYSDLTQDELQEFIVSHDEDLWKELVDNETTVTYGIEPGESLSFPVHGKWGSWIFFDPLCQFNNLHTFCRNGVDFVYYKNMRITDEFQVTLTSTEYDMIQAIMAFSFVNDFDEHHDESVFQRTWDKISNADHNIKFEEAKSWA